MEGVISTISAEVSKLYTSIGGAPIDQKEVDRIARMKGKGIRSENEKKQDMLRV